MTTKATFCHYQQRASTGSLALAIGLPPPTPPQFADEAATNKIHHRWLVRRWNKRIKPLPVVI